MLRSKYVSKVMIYITASINLSFFEKLAELYSKLIKVYTIFYSRCLYPLQLPSITVRQQLFCRYLTALPKPELNFKGRWVLPMALPCFDYVRLVPFSIDIISFRDFSVASTTIGDARLCLSCPNRERNSSPKGADGL